MAYSKTIFRRGINDKIKGPLLILLIILQSCVSGITDNTASRITLFYGLNPSVVVLFSQFGAIGTVAVLPVYYRLRTYFRRADLLYTALSAEIIVSLFCLIDLNGNILLVCNFFMGILRIMCRLDFLSFLIGRFPIMRNRPLLYGIYYTISQGSAQLYNIILSNVIEDNGWEVSYIISVVAAFISLVMCVIFFHRHRLHRKVPLYQIDWFSMFVFIIAAMSFSYTLTLGEIKDWFYSTKIKISFCLFILSSAVLVYRQFKTKRPYWDLKIFGMFKQVPLAIGFMVVMYFFSSAAFIFDQYAKYNFDDGAAYLSSISALTLVAYLISYPVAGILLHKGFPKRWVLFTGFMCFAFSMLYFFNIIQTSLSFNNLIIPYILHGFAYGFTMTTLSTFSSLNIPIKHNSDRVMSSVCFRYIIGSVAGYSLYSNWLYRSSYKNKVYLAEGMDSNNFNFMNELKNIASGFVAKGYETETANRIALASIEKKVQLQAMLVSIKDIALYVGLAAIVVAIAVLFIKRFEMHATASQNKYSIL